jgi:hypothetical protein
VLRLLHYPPVPGDGPNVAPARMRISTPSPCCSARRKPASNCSTATASGCP